MTKAPTAERAGAAPGARHERPARFIIMGPQGAGKGTQSARLAAHFGIIVVSTGEAFRNHIERGTPLGRTVQECISKGNLVPDSVTNDMVRDRLADNDVADGFILDGYPRNAGQVAAFDTILAEQGWTLDGVVELVADRDELIRRLSKRAQIEGRDDDTEDAIARRLDIYEEQTAPLSAEYAARGLLARVDGLGTVDEVTERLLKALAPLLQRSSSAA